MFSLFARAFAGLNLTPAERAFLKLLQGLGATALIAAAPVVAQALNNPQSINWSATVNAAISAGTVAVLLAAQKYVSAKGDTPIEASFTPTGKVPAPAVPPLPTTVPSGGAL